MITTNSPTWWRKRHLILVTMALPVLQLFLGWNLLSALSASAAPVHPPPPTPTTSIHIVESDAKPEDLLPGGDVIQAYLTVGLLSDKPEGTALLDFCPPAQQIEAASGEMVVYCYQLYNKSEYTFTYHTVVDSIFNIILENEPFSVPPGFAVQTVAAIAASATRTNVMTWTAYTDNGDSMSAFDSATVVVPTIEVSTTASAVEGACGAAAVLDLPAPGPVTYCVRAYNPNPYPLAAHRLVDDQGVELHLPDDLVLQPGETYTVTADRMITEPMTASFTWRAQTTTRQIPVTDTASARVRVPHIDVKLTFGKYGSSDCVRDTLTVTVGTQVLYCYSVINDGSVAFNTHHLVDASFPIDYSFAYTLPQGEGVSAVYSRPLTTTTTSQITWSAETENGSVVTDTVRGTVIVVPPALLEILARFEGTDDSQAIGVEGVEIHITGPQDESDDALTDANGVARFDDLIPGIYSASVVTRSLVGDLHLISPATISTNVSARSTITVEYVFTGTLPLRSLHLPLIVRQEP